jgi:dTDP-4-amino-4,6-dideoxygalactose transaminase
MRVTLADLRTQYATCGAAVENAVRRVLESGRYILGEEVESFEGAVSEVTDLPYAVGVSSGSDALLTSLWALGIGPGDEVVTTAFCFFATAGAIVRLGATPVFADIEPHSFNMDAQDALAKISRRTRAILVVHLFGRTANVDPLIQTGIPVVEDAAQAFGAPVGRRSRVTTLSFFPSKNLGAAGDAGMVLTHSEALAAKIRLMRQHGAHPKYVHALCGGNFRMDALQAAVLSAKLPFLPEWNRRRRENARRYRELLSETPLLLPEEVPGHVWHHFVVRADRREELRHHLVAHGIETEVYYPVPLHRQPCFEALGYLQGSLPEVERAANEVLALPVHAELNGAQLEFVAHQIRNFYR